MMKAFVKYRKYFYYSKWHKKNHISAKNQDKKKTVPLYNKFVTFKMSTSALYTYPTTYILYKKYYVHTVQCCICFLVLKIR